MLRFNWEKIKTLCEWDAVNIVLFLKYCTGIDIPGGIPKKFIGKQIPKGLSFIKNLKEVLEDSSASSYDIVQYVELCSRRNYADYKFNKILYLDSMMAYDTNVQFNRLITVINRKMYFKYETEEK